MLQVRPLSLQLYLSGTIYKSTFILSFYIKLEKIYYIGTLCSFKGLNKYINQLAPSTSCFLFCSLFSRPLSLYRTIFVSFIPKIYVFISFLSSLYLLIKVSYTKFFQRHLESHMLVHTDSKPFQCDQCDQSFR